MGWLDYISKRCCENAFFYAARAASAGGPAGSVIHRKVFFSFLAGIENADPFEGQGADCTMVGLTFLTLTSVELFCPARMQHTVLGKFMESLADEFRLGKPAVNPNRFSTAD
jgi:hypothetical protein